MLKKQLDYLSEKLNLGFWIFAIFVIMVTGSIVIILHVNNRFSNLIGFLGSLTGGLITLVSVYLTNRYYNQQKLKQDIEERKERITLKLNALKFLKIEIISNRTECHTKNEYAKTTRRFYTAIWEEFRKEFAEIFINKPAKEFSDLQMLYTLLMEQDNFVGTYKIESLDETKLFNSAEQYINKAINDYETKFRTL